MASTNSSPGIDWPAELVRHRDWMHGIARARVGDEHAADDVMQDVSLSVIQQNGRPTEPGKVQAWLYQVVVRRVADYFRKLYQRPEGVPDNGQPHTEPVSASDAGWVTSYDSPDSLQQALAGLDADDRQLLVTKYVENCSYRQLAEQLEISERAVEYRLVRAKERLRSEMRKQQGDAE